MKKILATAAVTLLLMTASSGFAQSASQGGGQSGTSTSTSGDSTSQGMGSGHSDGKAGRSGSMPRSEDGGQGAMSAPDRQNPQGRETDERSGSMDGRTGGNKDNTNPTGTPDNSQPSGNRQGPSKSGTGGSEPTGK